MTSDEIDEVEALCSPGRDVHAVVERAQFGLVRNLVHHIRAQSKTLAQRDEECAAMREALEALFEAASDPSNISTHDGWQTTSPRVELPKELVEQINAALAPNAGRALLAEVRALREVATTARDAEPLLPAPCDCTDSICREEQARAQPLRAALAKVRP